MNGWAPWFAWRPVRIGLTRYGWVWLRWLERKIFDDYGTHFGPEWRYRYPLAPSPGRAEPPTREGT